MNSKRFRRRHLLRHRSIGAGPNLTPMMDMFTIILVFLLKSYSVSYVALKPPSGIALPKSTSSDLPKRFLAIDVDKDGIYIEKDLAQRLNDFQLPLEDSPYQTLFVMRTLLKTKIEREEISGTIAVIRADRDTPFDILWRVMYTLRQLGFKEFQNLVIKDS